MEAQRRFSPDRSDASEGPPAPLEPTWEVTPFDDVEMTYGRLCLLPTPTPHEMAKGLYCLLPESLPEPSCANGVYCVLPEPPPQDRQGDDRWEITPFDDVEMGYGSLCLLPDLPAPENALPALETTATC